MNMETCLGMDALVSLDYRLSTSQHDPKLILCDVMTAGLANYTVAITHYPQGLGERHTVQKEKLEN